MKKAMILTLFMDAGDLWKIKIANTNTFTWKRSDQLLIQATTRNSLELTSSSARNA